MVDPVVFDPAAFVADFRNVGCSIELMQVDAEGLQGFAIKSERGYGAVMMRWADTLDETPDFEQQVIAYLQQEVDHA